MTVLRSREVLPSSKSLNRHSYTFPIPSTPSPLHETPSPHSPPLSSSLSPNPKPFSVPDSTGSPSDSVSVSGVFRRRSSRLAAAARVLDNSLVSAEMETVNKSSKEIDDSRDSAHGKLRVCAVCNGVEALKEEAEGLREPRWRVKGKRKLTADVSLSCLVFVDGSPESEGSLNLRSGKRVLKNVKQGICVDDSGVDDTGDELVDGVVNREVVMEELKAECASVDENSCVKNREKFSRCEKGKWTVDDQNLNENDAVARRSELNVESLSDGVVDNQGCWSAHETQTRVENEEGKRNLDANSNANGYTDIDGSGYAENVNGVEVSVEALLSLSDKVLVDANTRCEDSSIDSEVLDTDDLTDNPENGEAQVMEPHQEDDNQFNERMLIFAQRFREAEKRRIAEFAHFPDKDVEDGVSAATEGEKEIEDWPGPFSTAMKIARDRATKDLRVTKSSSMKNNPAPVPWIPRNTKCHNKSKLPPSLKDLCLRVLAKNADAIASLDFVPDSFRHRLSRLLCDSRKMNSHFLDLLLHGTPTEVCLRDCSWLDENELVKILQGRDTSKLMVLQLDQCGRCIVDSVLVSSLNSLPALKSLSLTGACRLSDIGITSLVSSAPALQYINLSQCSFLTSSAIDTLANSLGSTLRELHLNDCLNVSPLLMVSALKKLEHLEVLSLAGIQTVCDNFIVEFILARGHNMKELILTDCVRLTDKSIKAISETCSALYAIDLANLTKLSDYALCCLASGCQALQKLKLARNFFSDEAIAAFVDISGENLRELSLNNVRKVSRSTAISLACFSRNLVSLDLSWCRNLTDEALGMIVDKCLSLRELKLFGCTQVTNKFLDGHSNPQVEIIGVKLTPLWQHAESPDPAEGSLCYSVPFS